MSQHEIQEGREAGEGKQIAAPKPADDQLPLFVEKGRPRKGWEPPWGDGTKYLNEHGFPGPDWPGWDASWLENDYCFLNVDEDRRLIDERNSKGRSGTEAGSQTGDGKVKE